MMDAAVGRMINACSFAGISANRLREK